VTADGRGEREPVASDDDPAGAAQNRRVEVRFGD
jgi:flagellar motor protein MotB